MSLSRRSFIARCGCALGALAVSSPLRGASSMVRMFQTPIGARTLVLVNLEGAYDALSLLPPRGSAAAGTVLSKYLSLRPQLGWNPSGANPSLALSGSSSIGLHPALSWFNTLYAAGELAIIRKVGMPTPQLSHFKARDVMSRGRADLFTTDRRGWLGRVGDAGLTNSLDIVGMGVGARSDFVANVAKPLRVGALNNFAMGNFGGYNDNLFRRDVLEQMMSETFSGDHRLNAAMRATVRDGHDLSETVQSAVAGITLPNAASYPLAGAERLGGTLADIAKLIQASLGTRIFYTATGDYDTHGGQESSGTAGKPTLTDRLTITMQALEAFVADLKSPQINHWNQTAIVVFTEFGRRNYENQTGGTDHGHGFHAFVLGGAIQGGLKGNALTTADLSTADGYLPVEIDTRTIFKKCLSDWLQLPGALVSQVFDDFTPLAGEPSFTLF
jgi:uncharacterized protein (DUF1501 family)